MSKDRELDPFTVEQLLHGETVDPSEAPAGSEALAGLLSAAAAPGTAEELRDEDAAVAAFAAARSADRPRRSHRSTVAKVFTVKVAAALTLAAGAGAAAAAATDRLPGIQRTERPAASQSAPPTVKPSVVVPTRPAAPQTRTKPSASPSPKPRASEKPGTPRATSTPSPRSLVGLCIAYAYASKAEGKAPDTPGFAPLVTAAGGKAKVPAYCEALIKKTLQDRDDDGDRRDRDDETSSDDDHPNGRPTPHPTQRPTAPTTGHPTDGSAPPPRNR